MKVCLNVRFLTLETTERSCNRCIKEDRRKIQHLIPHFSVWCCLNIHQHVLETVWALHTGLNRGEWHSSCLPTSQILPMGSELQEEIKQAGSLSDKSRRWKGWRGEIQKGGRAGGLDQDGGNIPLSGRVWMHIQGFCSGVGTSAGWAGGEVRETSLRSRLWLSDCVQLLERNLRIELQGRRILQNSLSVQISPSLVFNIYFLTKYNSASHLLTILLPHWAY